MDVALLKALADEHPLCVYQDSPPRPTRLSATGSWRRLGVHVPSNPLRLTSSAPFLDVVWVSVAAVPRAGHSTPPASHLYFRRRRWLLASGSTPGPCPPGRLMAALLGTGRARARESARSVRPGFAGGPRIPPAPASSAPRPSCRRPAYRARLGPGDGTSRCGRTDRVPALAVRELAEAYLVARRPRLQSPRLG